MLMLSNTARVSAAAESPAATAAAAEGSEPSGVSGNSPGASTAADASADVFAMLPWLVMLGRSCSDCANLLNIEAKKQQFRSQLGRAGGAAEALLSMRATMAAEQEQQAGFAGGMLDTLTLPGECYAYLEGARQACELAEGWLQVQGRFPQLMSAG